MSEFKIKGCSDCPLEGMDFEHASVCEHPDSPPDNNIFYPKGELYPSWCPLIKEPITIHLGEIKTGLGYIPGSMF